MKFFETSKNYSLNKLTYIKLRWIAYIGQLVAILAVKFILNFEYNYLPCIFIVLFGVLTNLFLEFKIKGSQLNNYFATLFLSYDIIQLGILLYLTGGITNPFVFLIIIPAIFSAQYLNIWSSITLVLLTIFILILLYFFNFNLPHPGEIHFHVPDYYLFAIITSIFIGLIFLVYFGIQFGRESRKRQEAYDKMQEIMAKENELLSLGGQAAAAAHSLGTPLSTILLTTKEMLKEFGNNPKIKKDLDLLMSQSLRCSSILKKLSLNPNIEDNFIDSEISLDVYIYEIVKSFEKISEKNFLINVKEFNNPIKSSKSVEIVYGLRNFIGNANKFCKQKIEISLKSNSKFSEIVIKDDGPGFPKDLIDKHKLGEPYIRTTDSKNISKYGLGLGTFIGKTLLEKKFAKINFENLRNNSGAIVSIYWVNSDLRKV